MSIYIYIYVCVYNNFNALVVPGIVLARQCQGGNRPAQIVIFKEKEKLYPQLDFIKTNIVLIIICICIYIWVYYESIQYLDFRLFDI